MAKMCGTQFFHSNIPYEILSNFFHPSFFYSLFINIQAIKFYPIEVHRTAISKKCMSILRRNSMQTPLCMKNANMLKQLGTKSKNMSILFF